jgi:hypothetical protein
MVTMANAQPTQGSNGGKLLALATGGDTWVKLATLVLIAISGGGNFLATKSTADFNASEIERATREIHELYPKIEEALKRQQRMQESLDRLLGGQQHP